MNTMQDWLDAYGVSHKNPINKAFHWICVPVIFVTIIGLLSLIPFPDLISDEGWSPYVHWGTVLILVGMIFYLRLSIGMSIGMLLVSAVSLYLVKWVNLNTESPWMYFLGAFVIAWVGQFIGHKIEGEKPSFFDDLKFLLVGPAWLMSFIYKKVGIRY